MVLEIKYDGIGFGQEYADKIIHIFQRLHGRDRLEGIGIGLAICKRIVDNIARRIWAESKEALGATFRMILPLAASGS